MADSTSNSTSTPSHHSEVSAFQRTVSLYDWWLVKAKNDFQGKRLAVAGVSSKKEEAMRVFVSAPVVKRYDVFSLETADRIYVIINGFINEQRTLENGFTPEVFNHFLFGFPPNWESCALDCFREESTTDIDLDSAVPDEELPSHPEILPDGMEKSVPTLVSPEETLGDHEQPFHEDECNVSKEMGGSNVTHGSGGSRRSTRLHNIKVCQQKKQLASGGAPEHPDKEQNSTSVPLENCDVEGLRSPPTPIHSQSQRQVNTLSEQLVKKPVSRISRTLSAKTDSCSKKKRVTVERKVDRPKKKLTRSATAVKNRQEKDVSHLFQGSNQKISSVSPASLSFRKSRSGRLLLPPLEFWRNQIPVYNADHEITEIQEGASLVSPLRGSSASMSR